MLSAGAGHSTSYLLDQVGQAADDYYTGAVADGEPPAQWHGKGAEALGLTGQVDADVMHAVYDRFADPRDPRFADVETRHEAGRLGRAPKTFRTPEQVVAARAEAYFKEHAVDATPEQVQAWTIEAEHSAPKAVMFYDLTYSPPKSVTVLWAAYSRAATEAASAGDTDTAARMQSHADTVEAGIEAANAVMLDHVEAQVVSRIGRHGGKAGQSSGQWTDTSGIIVARFLQHTSRDHDPQLHVHNTVLNRVECPDGQFRAIDGKSLFAAKAGASAIASMELREALTRDLGVAWTIREDGNDFEIAGIEQAEMDIVSSRTRTMTAKADTLIAAFEEHHNRAATSWERNRLRQQATLATRKAKGHDAETTAEMLDRADAVMRAEVAGGLGRIAQRLDPDHLTAGTTDGAAPAEQDWSPEAVIVQAIEACHGPGGRSTFNRSDLARQIHLALPAHLGLQASGDAKALIEQLTDQALTSPTLVQTSGREIGHVPDEHRLANGRANTIGPDAVRYAAAGHIAAEHALLRAAGQRGQHAVPRDQVRAWLDDTGDASRALLSPAQREAVAGLASSDAALAVLVGPAGTGKSYTVGRLAEAWADLSDGGRVIGVATAQVAADVLRDDGLPDTANTTAFLAAQARLDHGRGLPADAPFRLSGRDILVVDEASMVDTATLTRLQAVTSAAGARMVLLGDPQQLGAIGAGGMMRTIVGQVATEGGEVYTLGEVRRFEAEWERAASLRLRDGDADVVADYDRHGRLVDGGTQPATVAQVARAAAADRLADRSTLVVAGSNQLAAEVSAGVRRHLVKAGLVAEDGVTLGRDGCTAGVGDVVQARRIDRALGLTNRETYVVQEVQDGGGLIVASTRTGEQLTMPPDYVATDAALAYASTVHAAQGATVDTGHLLLTPGMAASSAYVGLTRGRDSNTVWAVTDSGIPNTPDATARGLLAGVVAGELDTAEWSAHDVAEADAAWRTSAETLLGLVEDHTRVASRTRLDADLDGLVADGVLSEAHRARFGADQGSEHLARQLRALEQAGHDPAQVLRDAVAARPLEGATSVAQVISGRIDHAHGLPIPNLDAVGAQRFPASSDAYLGELGELLHERRTDLGAQLAEQSDTGHLPPWAEATLGPAPTDSEARTDWVTRAGQVAAHREATGWDSPDVALGRCPGVHTPEKRADWHAAYAAAGMPEDRRPEAELTDGRLLARAAAADRIQTNAPAFVDDAMRARHQAAEATSRDVYLARFAGQIDRADQLERLAAEHAAAAAQLAEIATERGAYLAQHAETLGAGHAARDELIRRGKTPGQETDRTTAAEWLAADHAARQIDDEHRVISEADVYDPAREELAPNSVDDHHDSAGELLVDDGPVDALKSAQPSLSARASVAEVAAAAEHAAATHDEVADATSQDAHAPDDGDEWHRRRNALDTAETADASEQAASAAADAAGS